MFNILFDVKLLFKMLLVINWIMFYAKKNNFLCKKSFFFLTYENEMKQIKVYFSCLPIVN